MGMRYLSSGDIKDLGRIERLTLINSITGYKPANLVATADASGNTNVAIISSVVHLGSDPALIGFFMRPLVTDRHTMENVLSTGSYTINHVHEGIAEKAHFTSADFPRDESEFDKCALTPFYLDGFHAPFVEESKVRIGMELAECIDIPLNGTILVIGTVKHILMEPTLLDEDFHLNLHEAGTICISGLDTYHTVGFHARYPYARPGNAPVFKKGG
jgi:flavin reductase (DIM6/NTAB) family NADH-FMN oxidoreductase RutF